jgi:hypothetical protein
MAVLLIGSWLLLVRLKWRSRGIGLGASSVWLYVDIFVKLAKTS